MPLLNAEQLKTQAEQRSPHNCRCALGACKGWESFTEDRWPKSQMQALGTLRDPDIYEPTAEEFHPQGTRYAAPDAPIAVKFFPYNVSDVFACSTCEKVVMRYTEFGGYYVDHRVREVDSTLVV
jgi:hypothetical protein